MLHSWRGNTSPVDDRGNSLTFRERVGVKKQSYINQISRNPSTAVELKGNLIKGKNG